MLQVQRHQVVCFRCSAAFALQLLCRSVDQSSPKLRLSLRVPVSPIQVGKQVSAYRSPLAAVVAPREFRFGRARKKQKQERAPKPKPTAVSFSFGKFCFLCRLARMLLRALADPTFDTRFDPAGNE